jgi:hypothetical protein
MISEDQVQSVCLFEQCTKQALVFSNSVCSNGGISAHDMHDNDELHVLIYAFVSVSFGLFCGIRSFFLSGSGIKFVAAFFYHKS